jgi:predicted amidophosphoribosyltransferase
LREDTVLSFRCPGSISVRQPIPETYFCPNCGAEVEVWTNERMRICRSCGTPVSREMEGLSCVQWCQSAKECIGKEKYEELLRTGVISEGGKEETHIPEKLKEFMRKCDIPIPNENTD